jgi:F-type H+-transporting ATPase subunit alpha
VEILKQPQYSPETVEKQVAIIYLGTKGLLRDVPVEKVKEFEEFFLAEMERREQGVLDNFRAGKYEKDDLAKVEALAKELTAQYKK